MNDDLSVLLKVILDSSGIGSTDISKIQKILEKYTVNVSAELDKAQLINSVKQVIPQVLKEISKISGKEIQIDIDDSLIEKSIDQVIQDSKRLEKELNATAQRVNKIQLSMDNGHGASEYQNRINAVIASLEKYGTETQEAKNITASLQSTFESMKGLSGQELVAQADKLEQEFKAVKVSVDQAKLSYDKLMQPASKEKITSTLIQVQNLLHNNTRVTKEVKAEWESYINRLSTGSDIAEKEIKDIQLRLKETKSEMQNLGKLGTSFFDNLKGKISSLSSYLSASAILATIFRTVKTGITDVKELDTALVDLKKTAKMSASELYNFYLSANDTAKQMGVTTQAIIEQASAWSRLGFNTAEAATKMAKYSSMFATISPGMDLDSATDGLVSVMKAFKIGLEDTDEVVDGIMSKINIIGNTQAVNNSDIVDFLRRSSSAMAEANNTLEDTIALGTSMVEITRDAAGAGQVLKTVSMRIRGYDEETEEFIGGIEELSGKIADLTKTVSTPGGISLFTDEAKTEFKSTRQLLQEISEIYDQLTDKNQAELLEALAGKRNGQAVAAILNNFDTVTSSLESMANSAGNAEAEMSVAMDSINYKLNKVKETGTGIAQNLFGREDMKETLDVIASLGNGLDWLTDKLGLFGTIGVGAGIFGIFENVDYLKTPVCPLYI